MIFVEAIAILFSNKQRIVVDCWLLIVDWQRMGAFVFFVSLW